MLPNWSLLWLSQTAHPISSAVVSSALDRNLLISEFFVNVLGKNKNVYLVIQFVVL